MNEKLTPLEALENIIVDLTPHLKNVNNEEIKIVETELKDAKKYKKAVEIIKKQKCIHILALKMSVDLGAYNQFILPLNRYLGDKFFDKLTQEEYELLKEILK